MNPPLFRESYPIDFDLLNDQDQHVIYITDEPSRQEVKLAITNASPRQIRLEHPVNATPGSNNYHFELRFRKGTLDEATRKGLIVRSAGDWQHALDDSHKDADSLYLLNTAATPPPLAPGTALEFTLTNLSADVRGGSRGSRAVLRYRSHPDQENEGVTGHRETHFNIVNHRGQQHIPWHVGFVGSSTVLNDGSTNSPLKLQIMNISNDRSIPWSNDPDKPSTLIISFDVQDDTKIEDWALGTSSQVKSITLTQVASFTLEEGNLASSPRWIYTCTAANGELKKWQSIDLEIQGIQTTLPTGRCMLYLDYLNIPGYWDGHIALPIDKLPISYREGNIDTGKAVMTGAVNDYMKAQFTLSGGGEVRWSLLGDQKGRLHWSAPFTAIGMGGHSIPADSIKIEYPSGEVTCASGPRRFDNGIELRTGEAIYAVHTAVGGVGGVELRIESATEPFQAPSNWLLVAVRNGDDGSLKLGTGATVSANSGLFNGSPIPKGTIVMWSGNAKDIPFGWALCDGQDGRPNLVGRFVMGAGKDTQPDAKGDPDTHTHTISEIKQSTGSSGAHDHKTTTQPWYLNHFEFWDNRTDGYKTYTMDRRSIVDPVWDTHVGDSRTDLATDHKHDMDIPARQSGPSSGPNRPAWYALCYIIKL